MYIYIIKKGRKKWKTCNFTIGLRVMEGNKIWNDTSRSRRVILHVLVINNLKRQVSTSNLVVISFPLLISSHFLCSIILWRDLKVKFYLNRVSNSHFAWSFLKNLQASSLICVLKLLLALFNFRYHLRKRKLRWNWS